MRNMTMAELREEIELKKKQAEELKAIALEECKHNEECLKAYLENILDGCVVKVKSITDDIRVEIGFDTGDRNDDGSVRLEFGTSFTLAYEKDYRDKQKKLFINHGTMGAYCRDDKTLTARVKAVSTVWDNVDEIEDYMSKIDYTNAREHYRLLCTMDSLKGELQHREVAEERTIAENNLVVGNTYKHWGDVRIVYKVTEKSVLTKDLWGSKHRTPKYDFISDMLCHKSCGFGLVVGYE